MVEGFFSFLGGIEDVESLEVVVAFFDIGSGEEVLLIRLADDVLDDRLELEEEFPNAEDLFHAGLEGVVVVGRLDLEGSVGNGPGQSGSRGSFAYEGAHTFLKLLEDVFALLEEGAEVGERAKHEILVSQDLIDLVGDVLAEDFDQLVDASVVVPLLGVVEGVQSLQLGQQGNQDDAHLVDGLGSHQFLQLKLLEEPIDVGGFLSHLSETGLDRVEGSLQVELALLLHDFFVELCLFGLDLVFCVSQGGGVGAPVDLFLEGGGAHEIELVFEEGVDVSVPLGEVLAHAGDVVCRDEFRVVEVFVLLLLGHDVLNLGVDFELDFGDGDGLLALGDAEVELSGGRSTSFILRMMLLKVFLSEVGFLSSSFL
jgi:hypothetical protein